jgi:hypothetical protein
MRCAGLPRSTTISMGEPMFVVELICCGRDDGYFGPVGWTDADAFRESYCSGPGTEPGNHERVGIIVADNTESLHPIPIHRYER